MDFKESLRIQFDSFSALFQQSDLFIYAEEAVKIINNIRGICYFTGVGKNMYVASRIASTFDSLGIRSIFIDPVHTLHGSMGIFTDEDLVIALSKSGNTSELIIFLKTLRKGGFTRIIGISANRNSKLSELSELLIPVIVKQEGDQFNLAPIASNMLFGVVMDAIAVEISYKRGYSKADFVKNHPGGEIGKVEV
ncbi:SIS domain-containing protein [Caldiplasma sukawensis]